MTTNETIVIEETPEAPKASALKKFLHDPKKLALAAGIAVATIGAVIWFGVKRMDEEDFESENLAGLETSEKTFV